MLKKLKGSHPYKKTWGESYNISTNYTRLLKTFYNI